MKVAKRLIIALVAVLATPLASTAQSERVPLKQIIATAPEQHPAVLYELAARLMAAGREQDAANWMYAGQLRYRFMMAALGDDAEDEGILFGALSEQVGRPVNEYIAGDVDEWIGAMQWALDWDAENENGVTSKTEFADELAKTRRGLEELIENVDASRETIAEQRAANGLPNR